MTKELILKEELLDEFLLYLKKKDLAKNTIAAYRFSVEHYFSFFDQLCIENLKEYRTQLMNTYLPATVNQRAHSLNHFLLFLEEKYPNLYPELRKFRLTSLKLPRNSYQDHVISTEDCQLLQTRLKEEHQDFWYFVVRFLVTTGVRVSELTQIKIEHLNQGYLDLYSKGGRIRRIFITDTLCHEAQDWCSKRGQKSGPIFVHKDGRPITTRGVHSQLIHFAKRYGIDPSTAYPHAFRHRFAKNFLQKSGDIALLADLLGHESIETTRIYLTKSGKEQQKLLDKIVTW